MVLLNFFFLTSIQFWSRLSNEKLIWMKILKFQDKQSYILDAGTPSLYIAFNQ